MIKCVVHFARCPHPGSDPTRGAQILFHSTTTFIAHLVNQSLAHKIIALQMFILLLELVLGKFGPRLIGTRSGLDQTPRSWSRSGIFHFARDRLRPGLDRDRITYTISNMLIFFF